MSSFPCLLFERLWAELNTRQCCSGGLTATYRKFPSCSLLLCLKESLVPGVCWLLQLHQTALKALCSQQPRARRYAPLSHVLVFTKTQRHSIGKYAFNFVTKGQIKSAKLGLKIGRMVGVSKRKREKFLLRFFATTRPFFFPSSVTR